MEHYEASLNIIRSHIEHFETWLSIITLKQSTTSWNIIKPYVCQSLNITLRKTSKQNTIPHSFRILCLAAVGRPPPGGFARFQVVHHNKTMSYPLVINGLLLEMNDDGPFKVCVPIQWWFPIAVLLYQRVTSENDSLRIQSSHEDGIFKPIPWRECDWNPNYAVTTGLDT